MRAKYWHFLPQFGNLRFSCYTAYYSGNKSICRVAVTVDITRVLGMSKGNVILMIHTANSVNITI